MTTTLPDTVPHGLPTGDSSSHEWCYNGYTLYHNQSCTDYPPLPSVHYSKVGLLISTNGQLHLFLDGQHAAKLAIGLPIHKFLFGAVDVYGRCTKIKSEILSGEWIVCLQIQ